MSYYPARFHFPDLVLAALLGFCIGALLFASPSARIEWENPNVVVAEVRE